MSEREITTLLSLMNQRQACLSTACKAIADWIDRQGDLPAAGKIRASLKALEADEARVRRALTSLTLDRPLPKFRS
ncbi:hypothetical protein IRZ81_04580 [Pseudomonas putida]|uniref:Uncharacterized protein n=1 Tax=Pseudomonas parafulva TaxID=157782 RepID=A0AAJ0LNC2_9PSED|nr:MULTISPECIES: hypothetical protein [Pseudomonas]AQW69015.1 hypothetical protein B2J77_12680 [Pseudomonas parafulva]KTT19979.1 hypothetical protein NS96R_02290 [Pseudomonas parafulva]MBA5707571.1 hypothetical protein [Pseudomonas fulva]MBF8636632.1 hypothetical protein [Pseudomonas fulva]MBF8650062.1 hypothetical protein [Pseudomonas putida]